jgi:ribosomal protein S14
MGYSDYKKVFKQLDAKPIKKNKFIKHNKPKDRTFGKITKKCVMCGSPRGHISTYNLNLCRRCFRSNAKKLGFKKYN